MKASSLSRAHSSIRSRPCAAPTARATPVRGRVQAAAFVDPFKVLDVQPGASEDDIKRAFRKLALKHHPDRHQHGSETEREAAEMLFMSMVEAYEILLGKARGKEIGEPGQGSKWDFHDWYWQFRMNRSWEKQQASTSERSRPEQAGYKQQEGREQLRTQLAGLRHRAAIRANRGPRSASDSGCSSSSSSNSCGASDAEDSPAASCGQGNTSVPQEQECGAHSEEAWAGPPGSRCGDDYASSWSTTTSSGGPKTWRRKYAPTSAKKEAVMGQIIGLRRKAAYKKGEEVRSEQHANSTNRQ